MVRVNIPGVGDGTIRSIRYDDRGEEIFTITLDDGGATPDGLYLARRCELRWLASHPNHR